jgi:hypothetical protein
MRFWERVKLGFSIVFGKRYGIIVDRDYASGGDLSCFDIHDADVGIMVYGAHDDRETKGIYIHDNRVNAWRWLNAEAGRNNVRNNIHT